MKMLLGLSNDITEETWHAYNKNPDTREIIQTSLFKIMRHIADADFHFHDFNKFTENMELIQYEIAALLAVFMPYSEMDFEKIYQSNCEVVPHPLKQHVRAGITKSAMNTFAGTCVAVRNMNGQLEMVYEKDSHFELAHFIGTEKTTPQVLQDKEIQRVDLYLTEFNHNISFDPMLEKYHAGKVIDEIEMLLKEKALTKHLTVAVDCTIDAINSARVAKLLSHFENEIKEGKLNFIFFRSGLKFDLFGMDHMYGSPYFIVNNGDPKWNGFSVLKESEAYKVDSLSLQWFALSHRYALDELDAYRHAIFKNTKTILDNIPQDLKMSHQSPMTVTSVAEDMEACFIDIKFFGNKSLRNIYFLEKQLYLKFLEKNKRIHTRGGYGYFNANINIYHKGIDPSQEYCTLRINPGLDPLDSEIILQCLQDFAQTS